MNTTSPLKIADKVRAVIGRGWKKKAIAEQIGISRPTFDARLQNNAWEMSEINALKQLGIL